MLQLWEAAVDFAGDRHQIHTSYINLGNHTCCPDAGGHQQALYQVHQSKLEHDACLNILHILQNCCTILAATAVFAN
jgi:hypothetical protein